MQVMQVLVVDDMDIAIRELKRLKLWGERTGFAIAGTARNGHEALEKLAGNRYDLVMTDIKMPKVDGLELLKKITENKLCECVVLLSDHSEFSYARQGIVLGAFDYIVKPVEEAELNKLLQRVKEYILGKRKEKQRLRELEEKLVEKIEFFYPHAEVNQIIEALESGDDRVSEYTAHTAEVVYTSLDHDLIKAETLLRSVVLEIAGRMLDTFKWLDKFTNINEIGSVDFNNIIEPEHMKREFVAAIDVLSALLGKLKYTLRENGIVNPVCKYVLENIDEDISLSTVADALFMNKSHISETFKQKTGITFLEYLTTVKIERAKKMLSDGGLRTYEVAELLGFKDIEYFSRLFKKYTNTSPSEYRQTSIKRA